MSNAFSRLRRGCLRGLLALFAVHTLLAQPAVAAELDKIVAVVNNEVITRLELDNRIDAAMRQLRRQGTALPARAQIERQVLDRMVLERIQLQRARELGLRADDVTLQRALQTIADNNKLSMANLRQAVETQEGVSWERFREDIRNEVTLSRLREREVDSKITVSDAEVAAFLASPEGATRGREFLVSHILLRAKEGATEQDWQRLQARADEVMRLVKQGDDFTKLVAAFSDAQDAMKGGSLDWKPAERLPEVIAGHLAGMNKGDVSGVIRSAVGLHIFKLMDVRDVAAAVQKVTQTHARHILLRAVDTLNEADARRRLEDIRNRVLHGADFAELARANSTDVTAAKGGDLGWLSPGDTVPEFEHAMDALKPGEISDVVQTPFGWHLIQVLERRTVDVTDERRKANARQALRERKSQEAYEDWLRQLRDEAYVDIRLD